MAVIARCEITQPSQTLGPTQIHVNSVTGSAPDSGCASSCTHNHCHYCTRMSEQKQPLINNEGYRPSLDDDIDPRYATESYQHQVPNSSASRSNVVFDAASSLESQTYSHNDPASRGTSAQRPAWQQPGGSAGVPLTQSYGTSRSWSLSSVCAIAWALPPFTSVLVLVWETENDLARFHAYQSGICGAALIVLTWFLRTLLGLKTIGLLVGMGAYGWFWVNG